MQRKLHYKAVGRDVRCQATLFLIRYNSKQHTMSAQLNNTAVAPAEQIISQILTAWNTNNSRMQAFFNKYEDAAYQAEVAPGRSRAIYLFGHLIASADGLLPLLGLGNSLYPQLEKLFLTNPDRTFDDIPSLVELKGYWDNVNSALTANFNKMQVQDWLSRHTKVSEEDFAKEPHRNKLNVLLSRTSHISYHMGQLVFLNKKEPAL